MNAMAEITPMQRRISLDEMTGLVIDLFDSAGFSPKLDLKTDVCGVRSIGLKIGDSKFELELSYEGFQF